MACITVPEHFSLVAERLPTAGTDVVAPELHRGSLAADTAAVQSVSDSLREPPIVLGHSYGGSVITGLRGAGHLASAHEDPARTKQHPDDSPLFPG